MKFRPCIDIHNGKVKQIIGSSLSGENAHENYVSSHEASYYALMYKKDGLVGGHIALLNSPNSAEGNISVEKALQALNAYPYGLQIGGGINNENAKNYLSSGASHVIVTSYVFNSGEINYTNLQKIVKAIGKEHLVLDLSCRVKDNEYYIVTDRWQKFTNEVLSITLLEKLSNYCSEFLIHSVDVEGKQAGIDYRLCSFLGGWNGNVITYAGGISNMEEIAQIGNLSGGKLDFTVGSGLDIFGGKIKYKDLVALYNT